VLAHLGVYKRYYPEAPDESFALSLIKEVFRKMISKGIALELNFSAYRKPYKAFCQILAISSFILKWAGIYSLSGLMLTISITLINTTIMPSHIYLKEHNCYKS
jgi:hypothetical protein